MTQNADYVKRNHDMADLYRSGLTLQEIGNEYSLTRERVRQIVSALGVSKADGGASKRSGLPPGVQLQQGKYYVAKYGGVYLGCFRTAEEAIEARQQRELAT